MKRIAAVVAAGCTVAVLAAGDSAQSPPQPVPRFRTGVDLVLLDVSVLDAGRGPVRGLTAADFTILENGRPHPIATFSAIDIPDIEQPAVAWMRDVPPDVQRNDDLGHRRIVVLVMDDAVPMPAEEVPRVRHVARRAIGLLGPDDLAAVVFSFNKRAGQEFTRDRTRLLAAIDRFTGSAESPSVPFDVFNTTASTLYHSSIGTLRGVAEYLIDLPERRKALIYVSVGVPIDVTESVVDLTSSPTDAAGVAQQFLRELLDVFRAAGRANVNVYALDPGGLRAPRPVAGAVDPNTGARAAATLNPNAGNLNRQFLETVSRHTGGFAVTNTNDVEPGLAQIVRENGSYYLLGYESTNRQADGRFRRVEVRVSRRDVTVRTRSGYYAPRGGTRVQSAGPPALADALGGALPRTDIALQVTAAPFALPGRSRAALAIVLGLRQPAPDGVTRAVDNVDVLVNAYDPGGRRRGSDRLRGRVVLRPAPGEAARYEVVSRLDLAPGRYQLRLAAQSSLQGKSGSVYYDVEVPDFTKDALLLSGLVLSATPGVASVPADRLASLVPVVPTTRREFTTGDQVTAFLRVYQGGRKPLAPVALVARIVDGPGATVFEKTETLAADRFSSARAADYRLELPIATLAPGSHLLTVETTLGDRAIARRDVRFDMYRWPD